MTNTNLKNGGIDIIFLVISIILFLLALCSTICKFFLVSVIVLFFADLYLFLLLFISAIRSDVKNGTYSKPDWKLEWFYPSRSCGIFLYLFVFGTIVFSFACQYRLLDSTFLFGNVSGFWDSTYFSLVTLTTVGYGDIYPIHETAKIIVMLEICNGILLILGVFPLLINRISDFSDNKQNQQSVDKLLKCEVSKIEKLMDNYNSILGNDIKKIKEKLGIEN